MRCKAAGLLTLAVALIAARGARAQTFYLGNAASDTAVGLVAGTELQLPVRATNPNGGSYYLSSSRLTFHYDPNLLDVLGVLPGGFTTIADSSTGGGSFMVSASGCASGTDAQVLQLRVKLKAGATNGTYVWVTADSTKEFYYCGTYGGSPITSYFTTAIAQLCAATEVYGDVDGNGKVESRDALITLSAAVGLPVNGFNLANGDVDGDGLTNSRDALMMLSYAIGLPTGSNRIAQGIPANCPPLVAPGEKVVFQRRSSPGNDTLYTLGTASTAGVPVANSSGYSFYPRLAADGSSIVYQCTFNGYYNVCRINADGSGFADLINPYYSVFAAGPDWSPDGTKIAFRYTNACYPGTMDSNGVNQVAVATNGPVHCGSFSAWSRDGTQLAFNGGGIWLVDAVSGSIPITTEFSDVQMFRWSPAGDSLAFTITGDALYVVPAGGGPAARVVTIRGVNYTNGFDWGPQGLLFGLDTPGRSGLWLLPSLTGPIQRVTGGNDLQPSFRRNP